MTKRTIIKYKWNKGNRIFHDIIEEKDGKAMLASVLPDGSLRDVKCRNREQHKHPSPVYYDEDNHQVVCKDCGEVLPVIFVKEDCIENGKLQYILTEDYDENGVLLLSSKKEYNK